jgi:hypothetical protein
MLASNDVLTHRLGDLLCLCLHWLRRVDWRRVVRPTIARAEQRCGIARPLLRDTAAMTPAAQRSASAAAHVRCTFVVAVRCKRLLRGWDKGPLSVSGRRAKAFYEGALIPGIPSFDNASPYYSVPGHPSEVDGSTGSSDTEPLTEMSPGCPPP